MPTKPRRNRRCDLDGTRNVRDLGGYKTSEGRQTKWGILYRGDQLSGVNEDDAADVLVGQLHIRRTYDLRGTNEAANKPYKLQNVERIAAPMPINTVFDCYASKRDVTKAHVQKLMRELAHFVAEKYAVVAGEVLHDLALRGVSESDGALIHCTLGKDRTGFMCSLLLQLLGVSQEDIKKDYLLTNEYIKPPQAFNARRQSYTLTFDSPESLQSFYAASPEFLESLQEVIESKGGIEAFAESEMYLKKEDVQKLREMLLE